MFDLETPLLRTLHGASFKDEACSRLFLRFDGAWMALTPERLKGVGNTLGGILNCPFKSHHLASGMLCKIRPEVATRIRLKPASTLGA